MSDETILYGRITGAHGTSDNWFDLYKLNKSIVDNLPLETEWPPLNKTMFSTPLAMPGPSFHRAQIIHFGASFKNFDTTDHRKWISKFEELLKKMYWWDAVVHFDIEMYGKYEHKWTANDNAIKEMRTLTPKPIADWVYITERISI